MDQNTHVSKIPDALLGWITVTEVADGEFFAGELFRHKYGHPAPDFGRHIVGFYKDEEGSYHTLSYLHFWQQERIGLIGGGCTDGRVMRRIPDLKAQQINALGGMLRQTLLYAFTRFDQEIDAFFGHAGDSRAREVDLAAGFCETSDQHLLIRTTRGLSPEQEKALLDQAMALGRF